MIKEWIELYKPKNLDESGQALREIMQEITLAGLYRAGFFKHGAFYGGTALRIFYGLNRFSEDLDFSLLKVDADFSLKTYLDAIIEEFTTLGIEVSLKEIIKSKNSNINSAFLKSDTIWNELTLENTIPQLNLNIKPIIKIKIEVDTSPPLGFETENKLLLKPYSFYVNCFTLPNLYAGKMHALLFRKWKNRVKGRDWYDLEWYIKKGIAINLNHFCIRANESNDWQNKTITKDELISLLEHKIDNVDFTRIKDDIRRFIPNDSVLEIWSVAYFKELIKNLRVE